MRGQEKYDLGVWETASFDGDDYMRAMYVFKYRSRGKILFTLRTLSVILMSE